MIARLVYSATGPYRWASHLNVAAELERWIRRAGLDVEYSRGFNPRPKISFGPAKPVGMSGLREFADIALITETPLPDPEFELDFAGADYGIICRDSLRFRYAGEEDGNDAKPRNADDWKASGAPDWWIAQLACANGMLEEKKGLELRDSWRRLESRRAPAIAPVLLRASDESEGSPAKAVQAALVHADFRFTDSSLQAAAREFLDGAAWIVEAGAKRTRKDVRPYAQMLNLVEMPGAISVFLKASASETATLPFMRVVDKVVSLGGIPAECVRALFLDADGNPIG